MSTFANAVVNREARTANGMKARAATANACTDLFFKVGALRGSNVIPLFIAAFVENPEIAIRTALWARDIRGGAGERQLFRDILRQVECTDVAIAKRMADKIPELGRFDDLLVFLVPEVRQHAFNIIAQALASGNGLAAKWMPRKGAVANELRKYLGWTPKFYRKRLVELTNVVETQMCAKNWDAIDFSKIPSLAHARYKQAFSRNAAEAYSQYTSALVNGDPSVKINAGAVYPYDVLKGVQTLYCNTSQTNAIVAQWNALPNFVGNASILPLVDVSGSMNCPAGGNPNLSVMDIAVSLGLYLSEKNKGKFKDLFLTFSSHPAFVQLQGNIVQRCQQMVTSDWGMSTNLHRAIELILNTAVKAGVPQDEMPEMLLILSDMQFNHCVDFDDSALEMLARKYEAAGYQMPKVIFWNLKAYDNAPVKFDQNGTALVSGFSPSILTALLSGDLEEFTPEAVMLKAVMNERYSF